MTHLSKGVSARSGEARGPKIEKQFFEIDEIPDLLHPLIYFIRGLLLTTGGYMGKLLNARKVNDATRTRKWRRFDKDAETLGPPGGPGL